MKKCLILLALAPCSLWAEDQFKYIPPIELAHSAIDSTLAGTEAVYEFQFESPEGALPEVEVYFAMDGVNQQQLTKGGMITIPSAAGKHIFQFYYNGQFQEVYSDSLLIEARHRDRYTVKLTAGMQEILFKPVIYLYPQRSTDVTVKIEIHGEDAFLYPSYTDSWNFTAEPNGDLIFGDQTYNYLFWEAARASTLTPQQATTGFFVEGQHITSFFEDKLTLAGFTSKEQADFITFWGPRLAKNTLNFIHFEFNETCDKYAELDISPKPDHLYRIFMVWEAVEAEFPVTEQEIQRIDRNGFCVLEWGGMETHMQQLISQQTN